MQRLFINRIEELEKILKYGQVEQDNLNSNFDGNLITLIVNDDHSMAIIYDSSKAFGRVPEIAVERTLFGIEQLVSILGNYIPVYDKNNNLLFSLDNYNLIRILNQDTYLY